MTSTQVQAVLDEMIVKWEIDALVIDHYISAMHIKLPRYDVKTCIIKLNREAEFYADQLKYEKSAWYRWTHQLDLLRLIWLERKIDNSVGKVIAIGVPDIPKGKTQSPGTCITPYLDRMPVQWRYTDSRCVFFVGNISHYPNRLAIEWIATKLAPEMAQICPGIGIKIVGCTPQDVRASWQQPNVQFLGAMDRAYVKNLFCHADLMLCPIENDFGMKFKSAEAIAFGTPLLASIQTLRGLTYLTTPPAIDLNRPEAAATLVRDLLACKERLIELSAAQTRDYTAFVKTQKSIWTSTLDDTPPLSR